MEKFKLFMIAERKNRIEKNINRMKEIKDDIHIIKDEYKKNLLRIIELEKLSLQVECELQLLNENYNKYNSAQFVFYKSECIQALSESIQNKEEQLQFTKCLKINNKVRLFNGFVQFYRYKNAIELEENGQQVSFISVLFNYLKQYKKFIKNKKFVFGSNNVIIDLIYKYQLQKENLLLEQNRLIEELEERKRVLRNYSKNKEILKQQHEDILSEIKALYESFDFITYKQKRSEYSELEKQNQIYQTQIENLFQVNNIQNEFRLKKVI